MRKLPSSRQNLAESVRALCHKGTRLLVAYQQRAGSSQQQTVSPLEDPVFGGFVRGLYDGARREPKVVCVRSDAAANLYLYLCTEMFAGL